MCAWFIVCCLLLLLIGNFVLNLIDQYFGFDYPLGSDDVNGEHTHLHDNGHLSDGDHGDQMEGKPPEREDSLVPMSEEDLELVRKWKNVMGPNYDIKV